MDTLIQDFPNMYTHTHTGKQIIFFIELHI